jgi:hypothetical protein
VRAAAAIVGIFVTFGIWHSSFGIALAQPRLDGYATLMFDHLPSVEPSATELRARIFGELNARATSIVELTVSGYVDGLAADRGSSVYDAIVRANEVLMTLTFGRADLQAGLGRVVWGRLDELQPGDVVNPLDVSRFFFEGRSEARLPVSILRGRWFIVEGGVLEGVYVPFFRRGRFDQLDEPTSPFNLTAGRIQTEEPPATFENGQGGVRFSGTVRRLDFAVSAYRGFRPFGNVAPELEAGVPGPVERFPRFSMVSGDFESVHGPWGFRGETAVFREAEDPRAAAAGGMPGVSWTAGFAIDRKTGAYRLSGTVLVSRADETATNLIVGADRTFAQDRYTTRTFGVVNVNDGSAFLRNITTMTMRDNVALEGSIGWFVGESADTIGRFADRDFLYARLKLYF